MPEIEIKPVTRIEGDSALKLQIEEDGTTATGAVNYRVINQLEEDSLGIFDPATLDDATRFPKFCVTEFRGFEKFVEGEQPETVAKLTPRICGVCPVPHAMASACATEDAYGTTISDNAKAIRRLMLAVHTVHSHALHFFVLAGRDFLPHDVIDQQLQSIIHAHNKSQASVAVIGGKPVHAASIVPGGQTKVPTSDEIDTIKNYMQSIYDYAISIANPIANSLVAIPPDFGNRPMNYLSSGIPFFTGVDGSFTYYGSSGGVYLEELGSVVPYDPNNVGEYTVTPYGTIIDYEDNYSYTKRPYYTYGGKNYICEVGPLARVVVGYLAGDQSVIDGVQKVIDLVEAETGVRLEVGTGTNLDITLPNTRNRHIARFAETVILLDKVRSEAGFGEWADAVDTTADGYVPATPADGQGIGVIEAPRGTLTHRINVVSGTTDWYECVVPTTVNSGAIEESMATDSVYISSDAYDLLTSDEQAEVDAEPYGSLATLMGNASRTVRGFDPCCSCSSHVIELHLPDGQIRKLKN